MNLSESDQEPYLTSHEADDEQSDWPRDESSVPRLISWWQENKSDDDTDDEEEKMLTTTDGTLQKIVDGALSIMLASSKTNIQTRIKHFVHREMLTGNRRHGPSKVTDLNQEQCSQTFINKVFFFLINFRMQILIHIYDDMFD